MSGPNHRLRLPKLWKKNRSESNSSHLGVEPERPWLKRPVYLCSIALSHLRIVLTLASHQSPTPEHQSRPGLCKKATSLFKRRQGKECMVLCCRTKQANLHEQRAIPKGNSRKPSTPFPPIVAQCPDEPLSDIGTSTPKAGALEVLSLLPRVFCPKSNLKKPGNLIQPTQYRRHHGRRSSPRTGSRNERDEHSCWPGPKHGVRRQRHR